MIKRWFRNRAGEQKGAVLVVVSVAMVAMIGATALAVDIGQVTNNNRTLQSRADVIALDAARSLGGGTAASLSGPTGAIVTAAQASATRNNFPFSQLTVDLGTMSGTTFSLIATPVLNGAIQTVTATSVPTAVRVTASGTVDFAFQAGSKTTSRPAIASRTANGGFSIGSWLASIPAGGDGILHAVLGDAFGLNAVSYNGLVNGNVTLEQIGLHMPVTALSPTQLLSTSVNVYDFMLASIAAFNAQGNTAAVGVLNSMIANASLEGQVKLGEFIDVASGAEEAAATASLNFLQLLTASAYVLEKESGHAINIPTTSVSIPGLASVTASATIIEPQRWYYGPAPGLQIETAQIRLNVRPVLNMNLGVPGVLTVTLNGALPLDLTAAGAVANLSAINCTTPSITVASTTQAVNLNAGVSLDLGVKVLFLPTANLARLSVTAGAKTTPTNASTTFISPTEFGPSNAKSVGSSALGLNGLLNITSSNLTALGVVDLSAVAGLVVPAVNSLLSSLDSALIVPLTKTLGVKFGGADIAALAVDCSGLKLVG